MPPEDHQGRYRKPLAAGGASTQAHGLGQHHVAVWVEVWSPIVRKRAKVVEAIAVTWLALVCLGGCGVVDFRDPSTGEPEIVVDQAVVSEWRKAVSPGVDDLNALGGLPGLKAEGVARVTPCSIDSGELFDLTAGRQWTATRPGMDASHFDPSVTATTARGYKAIIRRLVATGWTVGDRGTGLGFDLPRGLSFDTAHLRRKVDRTTLRMTVQVFDDGVLASLGFRGSRKACRLAQ